MVPELFQTSESALGDGAVPHCVLGFVTGRDEGIAIEKVKAVLVVVDLVVSMVC